jgi:hypothetical protein
MSNTRKWLKRSTDYRNSLLAFEELESSKTLLAFVQQVDCSCEELSELVQQFIIYLSLRQRGRYPFEKPLPEQRWQACLDSFVLSASRAREKCRDKFSSSLCQDVVIFLESVDEYRQASNFAYDFLRDRGEIDTASLSYTFRWNFSHQLESCLKRGDNTWAVKFADLLFSFVQRGQGHDRFKQVLLAYAWFTVLDMPGQATGCLELILEAPGKMRPTEWLHSRPAAEWNRAIHLYQLAGNTQKAIQLCERSERKAKAQRLRGKQAYAIEEIDFPRGQSRKLAIANILNDDAMKVEAYLVAGQVEEAKEISKEFPKGSFRGGRAMHLEEIFLRHGMSDEADKISQARAAWSSEEVRKWLAMKHDLANLDVDYQPSWNTMDVVLFALEDNGDYEILLDIMRSPNYSGKRLSVGEGRTLYYLGRKLEAAEVAERTWCPGDVPPKIDPSFYEAGSRTYYDCWLYSHHLGLASLYEEAGDRVAANAFLQKTERKWRKEGRWQAVLGLYFDLGRLGDVERVAREEDELECAIIAYEAANMHEEAARIYDEIGGKTRGGIKTDTKKISSGSGEVGSHSRPQEASPKETSGDMVCPSCNVEVKPNWLECPECGASLKETACQNCGEPLEPNWKRCPACLTAVAGSG